MCATRMDQFSSPLLRRRDPVLRLSNVNDIKSIINRFEKDSNKQQPTSPKISKLIKNKACFTSDMETVTSTELVKREIIKEEDDWEREQEMEEYYGNEPTVSNGYVWRVLRMLLYGLTCLFWASHMSLAMITVTITMFAPRMVTDLFIYPCCRLLFGTLYPAYASYKAVRTKNVKEYVKWMMYWIVFALFTCAETFTDVFFSWFPFYYEIKIILVFWLLSPATKGSSILYRKFVHPALCSREQEIDECITKAKEQGYHTVLNLGSKGVNYATNMIVQTALKSGGGLVQQIRKSYSLSDLTASDDQSDGHGQQGYDGGVSAISGPGTDTRLVRRTMSVKSKNPRPTSAPRVDMYFPEVDVSLAHNTRQSSRDSVNLSHIRSSEDISVTHVPDSSSSQDSLTRTSSVGSTRTRSKVTRNTFTSIKRPAAAEDDDHVIIEEIDSEDDEDDSSEPLVSMALVFKDVYQAYSMRNKDLKVEEYNMVEIYNETNKIFAFLTQNVGNKIMDCDEKNRRNVDLIDDNKKDELKAEKSGIIDLINDKSTDDNKLDEIEKDLINESKDDLMVDKKDQIIEIKEDLLIDQIKDHVENIKDVLLEVNVENINVVDKEEDNFETPLEPNNSDAEDGDVDFTTPDGSPVLKPKIEKSPKIKKRPAPPPPPSQIVVLDSIEDKEPKIEIKSEPIVSNDCKNESNVNIGENSTDIKIDTEIPESTNKLNKSKSKKKDSISKLLHLPSKFAFWNKGENEEGDSKSVSDKDSEFGSVVDLKDNVSVKSFSSVNTMQSNNEETIRRDSLKASLESNDSIYIPLSVDKIAFASKSTDV